MKEKETQNPSKRPGRHERGPKKCRVILER